ncbi:MAG TPA: hypothetical protein VH044_20140 [Polyangiaceae bacterium]|nr:hypothetical protein [Polyangiaceae bacterium]
MTLAAAAAAVACSSSSTPASNNANDGGSSGSSSGSSSGTSSGTSSGSSSGSSSGGDSGVACAAGATLYERLGGYTGIHSALAAIVGNELRNADIASYFFNQVAAPVPAGHPSAGEIEDCFSVLLASIAGGPYSYPPDGGVAAPDGGSFACRDMATIHQPLLISGGTFDEFVSIAATTLAPTVCTADLTTIGGALNGTKPAVVKSTLADAGLQPFPGAVDGGAEQ